MIVAAAFAVLLQAAPAEPRPAAPAAAADTSAYLDAGAGDLVRGARRRREQVAARIDAYSATARERIHAGLGTAGRERTIYAHETAARVHWTRDGAGRIQILGARAAAPMVRRGLALPDDLAEDATGLAFDPDDLQLSPLAVGIGVSATRASNGDTTSVNIGVGAGEDGVTDPLRAGSEAHYRFRSGDTTSIRLPDGTLVRLVELRVLPRRSDYRLVRGSVWLEAETYGIVRTVFQSASSFELGRDAPDQRLPVVLRALGPVRLTMRYVTVEYALWQGRWWLPRIMAVDAVARAGALGEVPFRFERSYEAYAVTAAPPAAAAGEEPPHPGDAAEAEAAAAPACDREAREPREDGAICRCRRGACRLWYVEVPSDTAGLLASEDLPPPLADGPLRLITGEEVASLAEHLGGGLGNLRDGGVELEVFVAGLDYLRYNRVEGLAVGAGARAGFGTLAVDGTAWLGTADREPKAETGVSRETLTTRLRLAGYRRLATFDRTQRAHTLGRSLSALLLGRDEADYLLATGTELTGRPVRPGRGSLEWRLFAEHQHPLVARTDVALARVWEGSPVFPAVRTADRADQLGAALGVGIWRARPSGFRWSADAAAEGQAGTYDHARAALTAQMGVPIGGVVMALVEGAAGTTAGEVPVQGLWYLGGPSSVRGYRGAFAGGEAFWRGRAEVATSTPAARLALFGDAGWVGRRDAWQTDPTMLSAGVGASFLDGLIRADLVRAMRGRTGWRLELYLDGGL